MHLCQFCDLIRGFVVEVGATCMVSKLIFRVRVINPNCGTYLSSCDCKLIAFVLT